MQYKLSDYRFFSRPVKLMLLTELLFGFASGLLSVHLNFFYATAGLSTVNIGVIGVASAVATPFPRCWAAIWTTGLATRRYAFAAAFFRAWA